MDLDFQKWSNDLLINNKIVQFYLIPYLIVLNRLENFKKDSMFEVQIYHNGKKLCRCCFNQIIDILDFYEKWDPVIKANDIIEISVINKNENY